MEETGVGQGGARRGAVIACGSHKLCTIQPRVAGKTGLKVELRRFDASKEDFVPASSSGAQLMGVHTGKKGSTRTDLVAAAHVENKTIMMPFVYLLVRHCYSDKEPLYAFGFINTDEPGKVAFICLREFRDAALHSSGGRTWILHGPTVVAEGSPDNPAFFLGRLTHTPEGLPKFVTSQVPYPLHASLVTCGSVDPMLGLACEQFALFVGPSGVDGQPAGRGLHVRGAANLAHLFKRDVLDGLALDYFADGAKKLAERFVIGDGEGEEREGEEEETSKRPPTDHRWIVVPLPNEDSIETGSENALGSEESPLPSPILTMDAEEEDPLLSFDLMEEEEEGGEGGLDADNVNAHEPSLHESEDLGSSLLGWIPDVFANRDNIAAVVFADYDAAAAEHAKPSIFLGTRSNELVIIRDGGAVACHKLPFTPLTITLARVNNDSFVLVVKFEGHIVQILHQDGTLLYEIEQVEDVLVGDFLMTGRDQVLLLHPPKLQKNGKPSKKDHFTLTDLHTTYAFPKAAAKPERAKEGTYSQSLQWVAYSLHCRLQEGQQFLTDGRARLEEKKLLFDHAVRVLLRLAKEEGSTRRVVSPYLANVHGAQRFTDGLVSLFDDDDDLKPNDRAMDEEETAGADLRVDSLVAAYCGGQWIVTANVTNTHASKTLWCQGLLVSGPKLSLAAASSGGFEDRIQLLPQTSTSLTTLVSVNVTTDATVDVWLQMFDDETTPISGYGCLGSLVLRVRDQLKTRAAVATPIEFDDRARMSVLLTAETPTASVPSLQAALEELLPVSLSPPSPSDRGCVSLRSTNESNQAFRITLRSPPGSSWTQMDVSAPSSSTVSRILPLALSAVPQGINVRPNALAGVELVSRLSQSLCEEVAALSALVEDVLERNRSRRKMLKIQKITREEIDAQAQLKRHYVERQAQSDQLFAHFLKSPHLS